MCECVYVCVSMLKDGVAFKACTHLHCISGDKVARFMQNDYDIIAMRTLPLHHYDITHQGGW